MSVRYSRLRARHGGDLFTSILKRIETADILIFDISGGNPNVCLELGCALALRSTYGAGVFILQESNKDKGEDKPIASDLCGQMMTYYFGDNLKDTKGFQAALLSALKDAARKHGAWYDRTGIEPDEKV